MTVVCLIRDGQFIYCLAINALNVAVFAAVSVILNIAGNLIAERIRGDKP